LNWLAIYDIKFQAGRAYVFEMVSKDLDAYLRLEDSEGKQLAENDDTEGSLNARITFTPSRDGTYRVVATSGSPATGRLTLRVQEVVPAKATAK
jgi:hypothetical protein